MAATCDRAILGSLIIVGLFLCTEVSGQSGTQNNSGRRYASGQTHSSVPVYAANQVTFPQDVTNGSEGVQGEGAGQDDLSLDGLGNLDDLLDTDIEQLSNVDVVVPVLGEEVTSVSRQESTVGRSPAAVYVITNEMIRRSGARSIPEALRLAPGVQVARIDGNKWSISIRGFNQRFANKLLVQIDGRTAYTPLFGGVYWDVQDVLLEDVERIEIVRGPGASVWGANAVNGIINIITKSAHDTRGLFAEVGGGDERGFASTRIGGGDDYSSWRFYGKWFENERAFSASRLPAADDWRMQRMGFRMDITPNVWDHFTFQGDYYDGNAGESLVTPLSTFPFMRASPNSSELGGGNFVARWNRKLDETSDWTLQFYYDRTERQNNLTGFREDRDTFDVDFQRSFQRGYHKLIWGANYRNTRDRMRNSAFALQFNPTQRSDDILGTFIHDEISLVDERLALILGSKFSWNDYTGFEAQPTARMLYTPTPRQSYWASFSRAVRTPTRTNDDILVRTLPSSTPVFPTFTQVVGNRDVLSEEMYAWEVGMREAPTDYFYWDVAFFYNNYNQLQTLSVGAPFVDPGTGLLMVPLNFFNGADAQGYGFEFASTWDIHERWKLRGGYSFMRLNINPSPLAFSNSTSAEGEHPRNSAFIHSSWDIGNNWEFDLVGRYVDSLFAASVPSYIQGDARIAWSPNQNVEFAIIGRQLLDPSQFEQSSDMFIGTQASQIQREVFGVLTIRR